MANEPNNTNGTQPASLIAPNAQISFDANPAVKRMFDRLKTITSDDAQAAEKLESLYGATSTIRNPAHQQEAQSHVLFAMLGLSTHLPPAQASELLETALGHAQTLDYAQYATLLESIKNRLEQMQAAAPKVDAPTPAPLKPRRASRAKLKPVAEAAPVPPPAPEPEPAATMPPKAKAKKPAAPKVKTPDPQLAALMQKLVEMASDQTVSDAKLDMLATHDATHDSKLDELQGQIAALNKTLADQAIADAARVAAAEQAAAQARIEAEVLAKTRAEERTRDEAATRKREDDARANHEKLSEQIAQLSARATADEIKNGKPKPNPDAKFEAADHLRVKNYIAWLESLSAHIVDPAHPQNEHAGYHVWTKPTATEPDGRHIMTILPDRVQVISQDKDSIQAAIILAAQRYGDNLDMTREAGLPPISPTLRSAYEAAIVEMLAMPGQPLVGLDGQPLTGMIFNGKVIGTVSPRPAANPAAPADPAVVLGARQRPTQHTP